MQGLCGTGEVAAVRHHPEVARMMEVEISHEIFEIIKQFV